MSLQRWAGPLVASALTLLGVCGLVLATRRAIGGHFVYPLDDAYIHFGVARTLLEHGVWGLCPAEPASASSSPLWVVLLAAIYAVSGPGIWAGLGLGLLSALLLIGVATAWLRDEGHGDRAVLGGLLALVLTMPLPFVAALGMEHVLHAALALALIRAAESDGPPWRVALLAGAAALTRYESAFVAGWLALFLLRSKPRTAQASTMGAALAIAGFGAFSAAHGGPILPNGVLLKSLVGRDWWTSLGDQLSEGAPLLALVAAATVGAAALDTGALHRRRTGLYALVALSQLALGRMGWLYRYEAWLMGWGALLLVAPARALLARPPLSLAPLAAVLLLPLGWRAERATALYVLGARFNAVTDVAVARWVAARWPGVTLAAQDVGALSFYTDARIVDVTGLGNDEIARQRLAGDWGPAQAEAALASREVTLAITGGDWLGDEKPASFHRIATLLAPYPAARSRIETVIWQRDPEQVPAALASLDALRDTLPPDVLLDRAEEVPLPLEDVVVAGEAVVREPADLAFYTNGLARMRMPASGTLELTLWGSTAAGSGPHVRVILEDQELTLTPDTAPRRYPVGRVRAGELVLLRYDDDATDAAGGDRNLFLGAAAVLP